MYLRNTAIYKSNTKKMTSIILMSKLNHMLFVLNTIGSEKYGCQSIIQYLIKMMKKEIIQYFPMQKI